MRVAVFPFDGVGHLNPQLALVSKLLKAGSVSRFYLLTDRNVGSINGLPFGEDQVSIFGAGTSEDI